MNKQQWSKILEALNALTEVIEMEIAVDMLRPQPPSAEELELDWEQDLEDCEWCDNEECPKWRG